MEKTKFEKKVDLLLNFLIGASEISRLQEPMRTLEQRKLTEYVKNSQREIEND